MDTIESRLTTIFEAGVTRLILSNPEPGNTDRKLTVRPVLLQGRRLYQIERLSEKQAFHENLSEEEVIPRIAEAFSRFRQLDAWTAEFTYQMRRTKKGGLLLNRHRNEEPEKSEEDSLLHNRKKRYLLPEGTPIQPLVELGIFTKDGRIVQSMYDMYRQIHRFVELIDEGLKTVSLPETLRVVDFGCGKSYLTFILYYFLTEIRHLSVEITGLDLKDEVIRHCNETAERCGYTRLHFERGDIAQYREDRPVDLMISLHACDQATDYALAFAIRHRVPLVYAVPCCQHEVNQMLDNAAFPVLTRYGLLKERFAAMLTDGLRAEILRALGYQVQLLEFVDSTHSPKNLLIKARYTGIASREAADAVRKTVSEYAIEPTLYALFKEAIER